MAEKNNSVEVDTVTENIQKWLTASDANNHDCESVWPGEVSPIQKGQSGIHVQADDVGTQSNTGSNGECREKENKSSSAGKYSNLITGVERELIKKCSDKKCEKSKAMSETPDVIPYYKLPIRPKTAIGSWSIKELLDMEKIEQQLSIEKDKQEKLYAKNAAIRSQALAERRRELLEDKFRYTVPKSGPRCAYSTASYQKTAESETNQRPKTSVYRRQKRDVPTHCKRFLTLNLSKEARQRLREEEQAKKAKEKGELPETQDENNEEEKQKSINKTDSVARDHLFKSNTGSTVTIKPKLRKSQSLVDNDDSNQKSISKRSILRRSKTES